MRILVGMSGGVDSSVAAALLRDEGHDVVGATMKLWGGSQDSGCCSVGDVEDARRVAQQLGITHHVFNFTDDFSAHVVQPYIDAHAEGRTPNPCVECNRHLKFDRFLDRAVRLGFDAVATGHHARIEHDSVSDRFRLLRGADAAKDQSYVLHMLGQRELVRLCLPVGRLTKSDVRRLAADRGLRTASKAESQDTCFITASAGREAFLAQRVALHPGRVVERRSGAEVGAVDAVELVTVGQRRGLGLGGGDARYALAVDVAKATVFVGSREDLLCERVSLGAWTWVGEPVALGTDVMVQTSAHGPPLRAVVEDGAVRFVTRQRRVAPGQAVVAYDASSGLEVLGGAAAA